MTGRQVAVCRQLVKGKSNQEIADALFISIGTVKSHLHEIFKFMHVKNRTELLLKLKRVGVEKYVCEKCGRGWGEKRN